MVALPHSLILYIIATMAAASPNAVNLFGADAPTDGSKGGITSGNPARDPWKSASDGRSLGAFHHVTLGVAGLNAALSLWRDTFGLEVVASRTGADASLESFWGLPLGGIAAQALVGTPGLNTGRILLVEFTKPGPDVRDDAAVIDYVPKNIDLYVNDLPAKYAQLEAQGVAFRSKWQEYTAPGGSSELTVREVEFQTHNGSINVGLMEVIGGQNYTYSPKGFAAAANAVTVTADADAESKFYTGLLGLDIIFPGSLNGTAIEKIIGLPNGTTLDYRVLGRAADAMGHIEVVEYHLHPHAAGKNLYPRAHPPNPGHLHTAWHVPDVKPLCARLEAASIPYKSASSVKAVGSAVAGRAISFSSPGGYRVYVYEDGPDGEGNQWHKISTSDGSR